MSTRAVYTFTDEVRLHPSNGAGHHVYKHHDGYPSGGLEWIANARAVAWPLPRFEADEFAAAFVAANKTESGDVRLSVGISSRQIASDAEYWYVVTALDGEIHVTIHECDWWGDTPSEKEIFSGTLDAAIAKYGLVSRMVAATA